MCFICGSSLQPDLRGKNTYGSGSLAPALLSARMVWIWEVLGACLPPTLLKVDLQQSLVYLVAEAPHLTSLTTIWSRRNQDSREVGTPAYPILQRPMAHDAFCGASGVQGERTTALSASTCKLVCHQPFDGHWPLVQYPWLVVRLSYQVGRFAACGPLLLSLSIIRYKGLF